MKKVNIIVLTIGLIAATGSIFASTEGMTWTYVPPMTKTEIGNGCVGLAPNCSWNWYKNYTCPHPGLSLDCTAGSVFDHNSTGTCRPIPGQSTGLHCT